MDAALGYLSFRSRTVRETAEWLDTQEYGEAEVDSVIERLCELDLLNDRKFAENYVSSKTSARPVSKRHLRDDLYRHKIPREIIEDVLSTFDDEEEAEGCFSLAQKMYGQLSALPVKAAESRMISRLMGRGYGYDTVRAAVSRVLSEEEE